MNLSYFVNNSGDSGFESGLLLVLVKLHQDTYSVF